MRVLGVCLVLAALLGAAPLRAACSVSCTATVPATASVGASVPFQSTATPCDCSGEPSYFWTFGDGGDSTDANPSHSYGSAGTYNWQLTVTSESATCIKSGSIVVGPVTPPAGTYSGTTSEGRPFSVTVNGSSQITGWQIGYTGGCGTGTASVSTTCAITNGSFACGSASCIPFSTQTSISGTFTSLYDVSGTGTVKVMPDAITCCTHTPSFTGARTPGPLTASAMADVSSGIAPLLVNFTGSATGGTGPYSYFWDFGDCTTSASQNPSHSYGVGNWNAVLTVTDSMSATDDAIVAITALSGPGITVTPTSGLTTSESGTEATFTVVLDTPPAANVTIEIHPSDLTEGRLSTDGVTEQSTITLTFTTGNWSSPQTVTVHGQNDDVDDGNVGFTVVTSPADSTDGNYDNLDPDDVSATNNDDDTAAVNVSPLTVTVSESGTTEQFAVSLVTEPTGDVVIDIASTDTGEATVSAAQLTFTTGNYATPQFITVTGVDDALSDGHQLTTITVTTNTGATMDSLYDAIDPADVTATTQDDEQFSIVTTNPAGGENAAPRAGNITATTNAMVNAGTVTQTTFVVQGDQTGRINGTYSASTNSFALDPTALLKPGELIRATARSGIQSAAAQSLIPRVWQFTAAAGAGTGAMMAHPSGSTFGSNNTIAVALGDLDGDSDLDAVLANDGQSETVWLNDGSGVFTAHPSIPGVAGGNSTYAVALGDIDGDGDLDALFANLNEAAETVWINDGTGGLTAHPTKPSFGFPSYSYDVVLGDLDGDGDLDAVVANDHGPNTVWLNDGSGDFSAHPTTPGFDPSGSAYGVALGDIDGDGDLDAVVANGLSEPDTVWLNDGAGNFSAHPTTPSFGTSWGFDIALGDVDGDGDLDAVISNYNNPQAETVHLNDGAGNFTLHSQFGVSSWAVALGDLDGDGDLDAIPSEAGTVYVNDGDGNFAAHAVNGFTAGAGIDVAMGDLDGDGDLDSVITSSPGVAELVSLNMQVLVTPSQGHVTTEAGGTSTFSIVLGKQPIAPVTIQLATTDLSEGLISTDGVNAFSSLQFDFTSADWSTPRTITIHGQDDAVDEGDIAYTIDVELSSADPFYSGVVPLDVSVTNTDDDTAGVNVSETAVTVSESGTTDTFTVVLTAAPAGQAIVDVESLDTGEATVSPAQLTFGSGDWSTPQLVTVTGVDDALNDEDQSTTIDITMNESTTDPAYSALDPDNVIATTLDDEVFEIVSTNPAGNENAAPRNGNIEATASGAVNAATVTQSTWRVQGEQTGRITGTYGATGTTLQLDPTNALKPGETIKLTATSAIQNGTALTLTPHVWQFTAATGIATGALAPHPMVPSFASFGTAIHPALGDLDGDGDLDAVFASTGGTGETVWLNNGSGIFTQDALYGEGDTYDVALGDLDNDGDLDFVSGNRLEAETVWLNDGNANFTQHPTSFNGDWTFDVSLGDLDGDGDLDVLLGSNSLDQTVWLNDGTGAFTAHPTTPMFTGAGNAFPLGDLDGDGDLDAISANQNGAEQVWMNDGAGNFSLSSFFGGDNSWDVALGDVDGDGDLDAVVANQFTQAETVWANNGSGSFSSLSSFGTGDSRAVVLGDLDGDGDLDAAVANAGTEAETIWLNNGSGTFSAHPSIPTINPGTETWGLAFGDLDGDGDLDALVANAGNPHQNETVWLNEGVSVSKTAVTVSENGTSDTFTVVLLTQPTGDVVIDVASLDTGEATVSPSPLTFTNANWATPQTVTVTGVNDAIDDGDVIGTITLTMNTAATLDATYDAMNPADVTVTTIDNDTATTTTLVSSVNPSVSLQNVTFTATVSGGTGNVTFLDGATPLGTVALSSGAASFSIATLSVGNHPITASYAGDANFLGSTSNVVDQVVNEAPFGAPPFVIATPASTSSVNVMWSTVSGATSYEVFRTTSTAVAYASVGTTAATSLTDGSLSANTTYLYKVRAINGGGPSALSGVDAATTTIFTDPTLTSAIRAKAVHMTQLRTAVNAMRAAAALSAFSFTDPTITAGTTKWKAVHVNELRTALDAARAAIGLPAITWTDATITAGTTRIKGVHITQLRTGVQ